MFILVSAGEYPSGAHLAGPAYKMDELEIPSNKLLVPNASSEIKCWPSGPSDCRVCELKRRCFEFCVSDG